LKTKGIYFLYRVLQACALPALLLYFVFRGFGNRGYWRSLPERFGFLPHSFRQTGPGAIWLHAVSVGEVLACVELLRQLTLEFKVVPGDVPEIHNEQLTAGELSQINAYRKARSVAKKFPDALVLGADTLVYLDTTLFGKPPTLAAAYQMLEKLQGRTHQVITGICLLQLRQHRQAVFAESTAVTFHPLDELKIRRYLSRVNPLDKAGAYAIQEEGDLIVEKIAGSYTNVVGLPMERLSAELGSWATR